jgi:hypothetical protein
MTAAIGIQIGIGTEIDEKARNSTPIAIAISISNVQMCHNSKLLLEMVYDIDFRRMLLYL